MCCNISREPSFSQYCYALLKHCMESEGNINETIKTNQMDNWNTPSKRCLDFLSFHRKGNDSVDSIVEDEISK